MITINEINKFNGTLSIYCLSTDVLPVDKINYIGVGYKITNGSTALLMDQGSMKIFDEENAIWRYL